MSKHKKYSEKENNIIERGKNGELRNIEEIRFYLQYLIDNKEDYMVELYNIISEQLIKTTGSCALLGLMIGTASLYCLVCGALPQFLALFTSSLLLSIGAPIAYINYITKKAYESEVAELEEIIREEENSAKEKQKEKEEQMRKQQEELKKQEEERLKADKFITSITTDISEMLEHQYPGFEEDANALYTLGQKYLERKSESGLDTLELLSQYPSYNEILWGIEAKVKQRMRDQISHDINYSELQGVFAKVENDSISPMSDDSLFAFIPQTEEGPSLELPKINYKSL